MCEIRLKKTRKLTKSVILSKLRPSLKKLKKIIDFEIASSSAKSLSVAP